MINDESSLKELKKEIKSFSISTLSKIMIVSLREFQKRCQDDDPHRELVILDGKVRKLK